MEKDWQLIHSTGTLEKAEFIRNTFEKQGLHVVVMNKKDSVYQFGDIELYVLKDEMETALELLKTIQL